MRFPTRLLAFALCALLSAAAVAADSPREMRGMSDTFATPGVAIAWGVLRAAGDTRALVDVRMAVDPMTFPRVVVAAHAGNGSREHVLASSLTAGLTDLRVPRATLDRFPQTEFRFYATAKPERGEAPALVVHFVGVPDGAAEFTSESRLDEHLTARIVRARAQAKTP